MFYGIDLWGLKIDHYKVFKLLINCIDEIFQNIPVIIGVDGISIVVSRPFEHF